MEVEMVMVPRELEQAVLELEEVRIVVRAKLTAQLGDYNYDRKAANNTSVSVWLEQRIRPLLDGNDVAVIDGSGVTPHGRTTMGNLRQSYER